MSGHRLTLIGTGVTRGLGRACLARLLDRLATSRYGQVDVLLCGRNTDTLLTIETELSALLSISSPCCMFHCVAYDAQSASPLSGIEDALRRVRTDNDESSGVSGVCDTGVRRDVCVLAAAGVHEPAVVIDSQTASYRYSRAEDFEGDAIATTSYDLHVAHPVGILELALRHGSTTFVYTSSQAAEEKWWSMGNALYGPQKRQAELLLLKEQRARVVAVRYGLIATDMAEQLYTDLMPVEAFFHEGNQLLGPPKRRSELFHPLAPVADRTAELIMSTMMGDELSSPFFTAVEENGRNTLWEYSASLASYDDSTLAL